MPRQLVSAKRIARAVPPTPYVPKRPLDEAPPKPTISQQLTANKKWKFEPREHETNQQKIFRRQQEALATTDKPHFRVGGKEVYFPQAKITLLRPSAKHTPYQAKFIVPRTFNKLDLRDYLWNVYGLRALNVTTQLLWGKWDREQPNRPRHRLPQIKKMTIEMKEPFIWPAPVKKQEIKQDYRVGLQEELKKYAEDVDRIGSDKLRPPNSFGGIVGPYQQPPKPFVPKKLYREMANRKKEANRRVQLSKDMELVKNHLKM